MSPLLTVFIVILAHLSLIPSMPTARPVMNYLSHLDQVPPPPMPYLPPSPYPTFDLLHQHLTSTYPAPVLPPAGVREVHLTARIVELLVHPTLEASLHLLNTDLETAEYVLGNLQTPGHEAIMLRAIVARVHGDYEAARTGYRNGAGSDVMERVWHEGRLEGALAFVDEVERLRRYGVAGLEELEMESGREIDGLIRWCSEKYGKGKRASSSAGRYDN